MRKKFANKPKNLSFKIEICNRLRKRIKPISLSKMGYNFTYYQARYKYEVYDITIYFQRYVRDISKIDYISIRHSESFKNLSKLELTELNTKLQVAL